jgi:hypothetical protein
LYVTEVFGLVNERRAAHGSIAGHTAEGYLTPRVVNTWINSPARRRNILDFSFKVTGIGYYDGFAE